MNVEEMTRELGKTIQQDERYRDYVAAKAANDEDKDLNEMIGKLNLIQMNYQQEAGKETPDDAKMNGFDKEFRELYTQIMQNPNMQNYEMARGAIDDMMNRCMQILTLCVNGADPETCEPEAHADCTGSCSSCGGGCH